MGLAAHRQRARGLKVASRLATRFHPQNSSAMMSWVQVSGSQLNVHEGQDCLRIWVTMFQKHHNCSASTAPSFEDSQAVDRLSSQFLREVRRHSHDRGVIGGLEESVRRQEHSPVYQSLDSQACWRLWDTRDAPLAPKRGIDSKVAG